MCVYACMCVFVCVGMCMCAWDMYVCVCVCVCGVCIFISQVNRIQADVLIEIVGWYPEQVLVCAYVCAVLRMCL